MIWVRRSWWQSHFLMVKPRGPGNGLNEGVEPPGFCLDELSELVKDRMVKSGSRGTGGHGEGHGKQRGCPRPGHCPVRLP